MTYRLNKDVEYVNALDDSGKCSDWSGIGHA